ncbi:alpha/beta hydrolase [Carboxylicivirga sp. N1Y90]|uniref:alpha/beta hydrolase n=1 Tax=Carboxylicivirga fragile TaxID=3417571 RepID=UPI003D33A68F|nr:alpha/beta hydrolase [Marinilabiliaceae bacterium N1Y90]
MLKITLNKNRLRNKILITLAALFCVGFSFISYVGPRMIIEINNEVYKSHVEANVTIASPENYGLNSESIIFESKDGLKLNALLIKTDSVNQKGTIILVHGIRSYKEHFIPVSKRITDKGFNAVLIDLRAHGQSEGKYCTFGNKEKQDISCLIDDLNTLPNLSQKYIIWGQSLGAAVSLQALSIDDRIKVGIIESTFSDYRQIVHDYSKNTVSFAPGFVVDYFIWLSELMGDFKADETVPSEAAKNVHQAVLMVHGEKDRRINIAYGRLNYENLASQKKEFLAYPEANHLNVWKVGGQAFFDKVFNFIEENIN